MSLTHEYCLQAIDRHLNESAAVKQSTIAMHSEAIVQAAEIIAECFQSGNKLLLCGNGGSAADCQHMAAEFTSRLTMDFARPGLPAIALTCDTSFLTAYANDFEFSGVFARQVQALGHKGDALIGISTSGNSGNVVEAMEQAQSTGIKTIALTGQGGKLKDMADVGIAVPSDKTQYIQECHLAIEHLICFIVERTVFGETGQTSSEAA